MAIKIGDDSPWEIVDSVTKLAKGVWSIGTDCHGGIKLSRENSRSLPSDWHEREWFEEDAEWVMAAVAFPHAFPEVDPCEALTSFISQFDYTLPVSVDPDAFLRWVGKTTGYTRSHDRVWTLIECLDRAPTEELVWKAFTQEWNTCDSVDGEALFQLMIILGSTSELGTHYLDSENAAFYASLPEMVTVYRGGQAEYGQHGIAWTTDIEVAKRFAKGHRGLYNAQPTVFAGVVPKDEIWTVMTDRQESEVVVHSSQVHFIMPMASYVREAA